MSSSEITEEPDNLSPEDVFKSLWLLIVAGCANDKWSNKDIKGIMAIPIASIMAFPKDATIEAAFDEDNEQFILVAKTKQKRRRGVLKPKRKRLIVPKNYN